MKPHGSSLIDSVIAIGIISIVFAGLYGVVKLSLTTVITSKARASALALAQERSEYLRSLDYYALGTVGGIPAGTLAASENVTLNGINFTRTTLVRYVDDPKDGSGAADSNNIRTDYKEAKIAVAWVVGQRAQQVSLVARFSPPGIEALVPGGTLSIKVVDDTGQPQQGVSVGITNASTTPTINTSVLTDASGTAEYLGVPASTGFKIRATKNGMNAAGTYDATATMTSPTPGHLTVSLNTLTSQTFGMDWLAQLYVRVYAYADDTTPTSTPASGAQVQVRNTAIIGLNSSNAPVYQVDTVRTTDTQGDASILDIPWGSYTVADVVGYNIAEICAPSPLSIAPSDTPNVTIKVRPSATRSLRTLVRGINGAPIAGVAVKLSSSTTGYFKSGTTTACGQWYVGNMNSGNYTFTATNATTGQALNSTILISSSGEATFNTSFTQ
jgi:hypothetical protein